MSVAAGSLRRAVEIFPAIVRGGNVNPKKKEPVGSLASTFCVRPHAGATEYAKTDWGWMCCWRARQRAARSPAGVEIAEGLVSTGVKALVVPLWLKVCTVLAAAGGEWRDRQRRSTQPLHTSSESEDVGAISA